LDYYFIYGFSILNFFRIIIESFKKVGYSFHKRKKQDNSTNVVTIKCRKEDKRYRFFLMRYIILVYVLFSSEFPVVFLVLPNCCNIPIIPIDASVTIMF